MTTQLRLIDGGRPRPWELDARTRHIGRHGVAKARAALEQAQARAEQNSQRRAS